MNLNIKNNERRNIMNTDRRNAENELIEIYKKYGNELKQIPMFCNSNYSSPYYMSIPDDWYTSNSRIMIVGEEGYGRKDCDGNTPVDIAINKMMDFNKQYLDEQIHSPKGTKGLNNGCFWRRFRKIAAFGYPCTWTNIDKIHRQGKNCKLSDDERCMLHSTNTKILNEEIRILQPSHIVFFGWYGISLLQECPSVFNSLYPKGLGDSSKWKNNIVKIKHNGKDYIFTYHPSYGYRKKGYEERVMKALENIKTEKQYT